MKINYLLTKKITFCLFLTLTTLTAFAQPYVIPGQIEAENYATSSMADSGDPIVAIKGFTDNRSVTYSVNVTTAGVYTLYLRQSSRKTETCTVKISTDAVADYEKVFSFNGFTGDWNTYQTVALGTVDLPAGSQTITLTGSGVLFQMDYFSLETTQAEAVTGFSISSCPTEDLIVGLPFQLTSNIYPALATNTNVTWSSSNDAIATVDAAGVIIPEAAGGPVTITGTTEDGGFTDQCIDINVVAPQLGVNLIQNGTFDNADLNWSLGFNSNKVTTASNYTNLEAEFSNITPLVAEEERSFSQIKLSQPISFSAGYNYTLTFNMKATEAKQEAIQYGSQISSIGTLAGEDINGGISDITTGFTQFSYTWHHDQGGQANMEIQLGLCNGTVTIDDVSLVNNGLTTLVTDVSITGSPVATMSAGGTQQLAGSVSPESANFQTLKWSSSNPEFVTVDQNGLVTAVAEGVGTISVKTEFATVRDEFEVTVDGTLNVGTLKETNKFKMYPNPTKDKLTIMGMEGATITIFNTLGNMVLSTKLSNNSQAINLNHLPIGLYIVKSDNNGFSAFGKLVRN